MSQLSVEVVEVAQTTCFELIEPGGSGRLDAPLGGRFPWPKSPGAARAAADGQLEALHFAPGRWLLPEPSAELLAVVRDSSAILVDVEGKWQRRSLRGKGAMRLLAAAADVEAMLTGRDCAALTLFDCPAIVARGSGAIELWVQSSYAQFLGERLASSLKARASFPC